MRILNGAAACDDTPLSQSAESRPEEGGTGGCHSSGNVQLRQQQEINRSEERRRERREDTLPLYQYNLLSEDDGAVRGQSVISPLRCSAWD